jgi:hypothetical protein
MAINYGTLGLTLTPPPTYGTAQTSTGGPSPSNMPQFPIGTGRASGTGSVGSTTTTQYGDDNTYTGTLDVKQIDKLTSAPVDKTAKSYPEGIKGWLEEKIDSALAPNMEYNSVTGTYRATDAGAAGIVAPMFAGAFQFAADLNKANLEGIADAAYRGKEGYGVAYFNNQVVGVSPGLFGLGSVLSGTLPSGMTAAQEAQLKSNILGLENRSGAYDPNLKEEDFNNIISSGLTPEQYYDFSPNVGPYSGLTTGLPSTYSSGITGGAGFAPTPTYGGSMGYGSDGTGYSVGAGRSAVTDGYGNVVTSFDYNTGQRAAVTSTDYGYSGGGGGGGSYNDDGTDLGSNEYSGGQETSGDAISDAMNDTDNFGLSRGGRVGLAPGGRADGPGSESEGHSSHGFDGGRRDAGGNEDHSNSGGSESYDRSAISQQIQAIISNVVQNQPMTPEERFASNAAMIDKTPDLKTLDAYKEAGISVGRATKPEETGFGQSISEAISALGQYGILGALGLVPFREGGDVTEGFVNKDPKSVSDAQSIADNRYTSVKAGSFVVNQPANEKNKKKLDKIVADASKTAKMKKGGKAGMVDVALSDGERLIEPEVVAAIEKKHGKNFLDKLNDAGKPEVKRRQAKYGEKVGAAQGSFITDQGMELGDVGDDVDMQEYMPVSDELKAKLSKFAAKKPQRGQIKSFIKSLSPEDKLTVLFLTETQSTTDPVESMEAIGEVVKNRIGSDYYDFKDIKTLDDALLKQTRKGAFHFSGLEPSTLYARAKEVKKGLADKGLAKAYAAAQNTLDPEAEGASRLPANTVFYTRKDAPSQWMRESKDLEFSTELGGHEFYRTFAAPEFP